MEKRISLRAGRLLALAAVLAGFLIWRPAESRGAQAALVSAGEGLSDGEYTVSVELSGGTGKASITSPATMRVTDGKAYVRIEWSSANYDYMLVESEKYLPVNDGGNSVFEIPVLAFDEPVTVIADTTAMSRPHEIEYTLIFHPDGKSTQNRSARLLIPAAFFIAALCALCAFVFKKRRNSVK